MDDVEILKSTEKIRLLEARYARYADEKRWTDLAGLFTIDGTFTSKDVDGNAMVVMSGRQGIAETLAGVGTGDVTLIHMLFTSEIEILSPTTARGIWAMADIIVRDGDVPTDTAGDVPAFRTMRGWGHYHVDYVKVDGEWFISKRTQDRTRLEFE